MSLKENKKMWICPSPKEQKAGVEGVLPTLLALIAAAVSILSAAELTGFSTLYTPWVMLLASGVVCAAFWALTDMGRQTWFVPAMLSILLFLVLLFSKQILNGFCLSWNQMGSVWTAGTGRMLPMLEADAKTQNISLLLFSVSVGIAFGTVGCVLTICRIPVLPLLLPGTVLTGMLLLGKSAEISMLLPALAASALLLGCSGNFTGKENTRGVLVRLLVVALAGILLLPGTLLPNVQQWAKDFSKESLESHHEKKYETAYTTLPEGDFTDFRKTTDKAKPALVVNMEQPQAMFLRGFTGTGFEGDRWVPLDRSILTQERQLLYWLQQKAFNLNSQYEVAATGEDLSRSAVTVQNIGACSQYLYVPYNLCAGELLDEKNLNTDGVLSSGERIYIFSVLGDWQKLPATLEHLRTSEDEAVLRYREAESAYRSFVYDNYLTIPQDVAALLQDHWNQSARYGAVKELTFEQAQECVLSFLGTCFPEGETPAFKLPLEIAEGTSYQYATVAVMSLRYFGIPARYAEGYVVTEEMAEAAQGEGRMELTSNHGAAWAEVYQDGIGWIPMALTPGAQGLPQGMTDPLDPNGQNHLKNPEEGKEVEEEPPQPEEEPQPDGGYTVMVAKAMLWSIVAVVSILLLLVAALLLRRKWQMKRKQKKLDAEDPKEAVAWIFADTVTLLAQMGIHRGNGSMHDLGEPIRQQLGDRYAQDFSAFAALNSQALFSSREMPAVNKVWAAEFRNTTVACLKSSKKWYQRLWMQWVLCLY